MRYIKYLFNITLLLILVLAMLPYRAQAVIATLSVAGEGDKYFGGAYHGGAADYTVLNSNDGASSYWAAFTPYNWQSWRMSAYAGGTTINSVSMSYSWSGTGVMTNVWPFVRISGVNYNGLPDSDMNLFLVFHTVTNTWATNPATGLAWTSADINSAYFGLNHDAALICSYLYVTVDYSSAVPSVTTVAASTPTYLLGSHAATLNGEITATGGLTPDLKGFAWSTTSNTTAPGNIVPPATYTSNWTTGASGTGAFSRNVAGLVKNTTYYYRAYAHNAMGWAWGNQLSFTTLGDPSISILSATNIASSSARLNSVVTNDGRQACGVRFAYGTVSKTNFADYTYNTTLVDNIYVTGNNPYADITGLTIATTYYYRAQIINDVSTQVSTEGSFTTSTGVTPPINFKGIPTSSSISISWEKGVGSNKTLIMYKKGSYPTSLADGGSAYFGTDVTAVITGLVPGSSYYFRAWGETSGYYSTSNTTLLVTTLAGSAATPVIPTPATPDNWFQAPDYTNMANTPFYSIVNFAADAFAMPRGTLWYMCALFFCVAVGVFFYSTVGNANLFLSVCAVGAMMAVCSAIKLVPLWQIIPLGVFALVGIFVGERR